MLIKVEAIKEALDRVSTDSENTTWNNTEWTTQVKKALVSLARLHNLKTYASGCGADGKEWLHDFAAMGYEYNPVKLSKMALIAESEWLTGTNEIEDDFLRLVVSRADLRVMIFQSDTTIGFESIAATLLALAQGFELSRTDDLYLLACWVKSSRRFEYLSFRTEHLT